MQDNGNDHGNVNGNAFRVNLVTLRAKCPALIVFDKASAFQNNDNANAFQNNDNDAALHLP